MSLHCNATASRKTAMLVMSLTLGVSSCGAGVTYILENYQGVPLVEVAMPDDTYRVFDKPAENRMMITQSIGSAAGIGFASGLTFGTLDTSAPKPRFEAAAVQHLANTSRQTCRVIDAYLLQRPQWEVRYDCARVSIVPTIRRRM